MTPNDITVAYPGREGAHSAAACDRLFPAARIVAQASFSDVVEAVTSGMSTYGVLPIESSLVGPVNETHDLLYDSALSIGSTPNGQPPEVTASTTSVKDACGTIRAAGKSRSQAAALCAPSRPG